MAVIKVGESFFGRKISGVLRNVGVSIGAQERGVCINSLGVGVGGQQSQAFGEVSVDLHLESMVNGAAGGLRVGHLGEERVGSGTTRTEAFLLYGRGVVY